jgi:hypothetical protein
MLSAANTSRERERERDRERDDRTVMMKPVKNCQRTITVNIWKNIFLLMFKGVNAQLNVQCIVNTQVYLKP